MDSDLTSISTFGWYNGVSVSDTLEPISTFGWWFTLAPTGDGVADLLCFILYINTRLELEL